MKYLLLFLISGLICFSGAKAQKKPEYTFPDDIADSGKNSFVKQFNQGKALYKISCAKCHNLKEGGKEFIPDFSLPQLMDYEIRIYPQHVEEMPESRLAEGEIIRIIVYLRYKERSGKTIHPPPKE